MNESNPQHPKGVRTGHVLLLLGFFLLAYLLPIGARDLVVPDETRYAEIPREMIASGDWVVPRIDGVRYFEKPVLGYWVHAVSILLLGENNFAVRLPSGLAVGLTALLIFLLVHRVRKKDDEKEGGAAVLATLIFMSCFAVFGIGNTAVLDSLLSLFLTGSIAAFFFATEQERGSRKETYFLLLAGFSCGLAFLTKGFLAFVVPVLALVPYLAWQRRWRDILRMSWLPILTAVLVSLPWAILIQMREPDYWNFFFWNEHVRRFLANNAQHKETAWYFVLVAPAMFFPWLLTAPAAIPGILSRMKGQDFRGRLMRLSVCWLVLPFLFFTSSSGKLLTYILPCFPPFAILMSFGLLHVFSKKWSGRLLKWGIGLCALLFFLALAAVLYIQFIGPHEKHIFDHPWKAITLVNGFLFYFLLCIQALRSRRVMSKLLLFALAPLFFFFVAHFILPDSTIDVKCPGPLLERNKPIIDENCIVITDTHAVRAVCWYLHRSDVYLLNEAGELTYGFNHEDARSRNLDMQSAIDMIRKNPGKVVVIGRISKEPEWREQLPEPVFRDSSGPKGFEVWKY